MRAIIIASVWPEPRSSAAGLRDQSFIDIFKIEGWDLTYLSPCKDNAARSELDRQGVRSVCFLANDSGFDLWLEEEKKMGCGPDVVIFDRLVMEEQFGWRVKAIFPEALRVLDTQDLHFLRRSRQTALKKGDSLKNIFEFNIPIDDSTKLRELASIFRSDLALFCSEYEIELLADSYNVPRELMSLSSFYYPKAPELKSLPSFKERKDFSMIGNFRHPPNLDGLFWFENEIWPGIRKSIPEAEVHIYGAYPPKEAMKLNNSDNGFRVLGFTENACEKLKNYRVNLAPLRFGAGIKGKIADGWWAGTPIATTPIGAEGMRGKNGFGGEVASSSEEFIQNAVKLYREKTLWETHQTAGRSVLEEKFSFDREAPRFLRDLVEGFENKVQNRRKNITGELLWSEQHQSKKYMSKWIELKNGAVI